MSRRRHALTLAAWLAPLTFALATAGPLIAAATAAGDASATATNVAQTATAATTTPTGASTASTATTPAAGKPKSAPGTTTTATGASTTSTATTPAAGKPKSATTTTTTPTATKPATTTPTTTTPTATKPATTTAPAKATLKLFLFGAFFVHGQPLTVPGRGVQVGGVVAPYVPGQWVTVRALVGRRLIKSDRLLIKPSRTGSFGRFTETLASSRAGQLSVTIVHARTAQQVGLLARRTYTVLAENAGFGSTGKFVALIQQRLAALHFYLPQSGVYDQQTGLAIDAYHRLLGWGTDQTLDGKTISYLLDGFGAFKVRYPGDGTHVEGNLSKQVLALINGSQVYRIYPISSGKPSTPTILGHFHVYSRVPGYLPDGMYYSDFFYNGYAIHGYDPAPDYPASHGCMRLPIIDAISVFNWLTYGDVVDVYY